MSSGIIDKNNRYLNRHPIRLKNFDYSRAGAYFITICTNEQKNIFGEIKDGKTILNEFGEVAVSYWNTIPEHYADVELDEFVVMPNHIHGIIIINNIKSSAGAIRELPLHELQTENDTNSERISRRKMTIPKIIGYFKMNTSKSINRLQEKHGGSLWQRNYYEHIVRNNDELNRIREYIINNPAKWDDDKYNLRNIRRGNS